MRQSTRRDIKDAVDQVLRPHASDVYESLGTLAQAVELLGRKVRAIQPARVDLTQEMADDIVRKIHGPLTISQDCSTWLAGLATGHDIYTTHAVGYGSTGGRLDLLVKTNGTLYLEIRDHLGDSKWRGTFVPPHFAES